MSDNKPSQAEGDEKPSQTSDEHEVQPSEGKPSQAEG